MNSQIVDEIIEEISSTLERIETQSTAVLELMKEKGIAKDEELAPYLERAAAASSVRWRATRVRLAHLFSGLEKSERQGKEQEKSQEEKDSKKREGAHKGAPVQEPKQKGGTAEVPEAVKTAEESSNQQTSSVAAPPGPKAGQAQAAPSNKSDKAQKVA